MKIKFYLFTLFLLSYSIVLYSQNEDDLYKKWNDYYNQNIHNFQFDYDIDTINFGEIKDTLKFLQEMKDFEFRKQYFQSQNGLNNFSKPRPSDPVADCGFDGVLPLSLTFYSSQYLIGYPFNIDMNEASTTYPVSTTTFNNFSAKATMVNDDTSISQGYDPILLQYGIQMPRVYSGSKAIKMNSYDGGVDVTTFKKKFTISQDFISFRFSLIVQNPDPSTHPPGYHEGDQPVFLIRLYDNNSNIVDYKYIQADSTNPIFNVINLGNNNSLLYTGWVCENFNVARYIGQQLTATFTVTDCNQGAHFGSVYIDDICNTDNPCNPPLTCGVDFKPQVQNRVCPTFPYKISGHLYPPTNSTLTYLNINIYNADNNMYLDTINILSSVSGSSSYNFLLQQSDLPSNYTKFNFEVEAEYMVANNPAWTYQCSDFKYYNDNNPDLDITNCKTLKQNELLIYQNPTSDYLILDNVEEYNTIQIINQNNTIVRRIDNSDVKSRIQIQLSEFNKGIYFILFSKKDSTIEKKKIIIK